jgi:phage/plasmid-associated DNA primase
MDEPGVDEVINAGILKGLTGNDSFWARDLFQKGKDTREIQPMFKIHIICNKIPTIADADHATWNRIRVIPFESTFEEEDNCPSDIEEQFAKKIFPIDKNFSNQIPNMIQPFAWYLIRRWKNINKYVQIEPEKVKIATALYRSNNDIYKQFEDHCILEKENSKLSIITLYSYFKEWYRDEFPTLAVPNRNIVRQHYTCVWGEPDKNKYWLNKACHTQLIEPTHSFFEGL